MARRTKRKRLSDLPRIVIDTREQLPYEFDFFESRTVLTTRAALHTGDYSLEGYEDRVCVERKTKMDLYGSLGKGRKRFKREFERLEQFEYSALVIEAGMTDLTVQPDYSKMNPSSVINSLVAWSQEYDIPIWLCDCRYYGELITLRILEKFWMYDDDDINEEN